MRASARRFLVREDDLQISDYAAALVGSLTIPFRLRRSARFLGIDVGGLVREEARSELGSWDLVDGILTFRFLARLKAAGTKLRLVLDWWEGQSADRALALAVRGAFPETPLIGYCGAIVCDEELSSEARGI